MAPGGSEVGWVILPFSRILLVLLADVVILGTTESGFAATTFSFSIVLAGLSDVATPEVEPIGGDGGFGEGFFSV